MSEAAAPLHALVSAALDAAAEFGATPCHLVATFPLTQADLAALASDRRVAGIVVRDAGTASQLGTRLVAYHVDGPQLEWPEAAARALVYLGWPGAIKRSLLLAAARHGVRRIVYPTPDGWRSQTVAAVAAGRIAGTLMRPPRREIARRREARGHSVASRAPGPPGRRFERIVALAPPAATQGTGVTLYSGGLGAGGAERQIANTLTGLAARGGFPVRFYAASRGQDFYLPAVRAAGVAVWPVVADGEQGDDAIADLPGDLFMALCGIEPGLARDIVGLRQQLLAEPPAVLHCWQDHTNIAGGLAGLLAGVPRVVLSGRSVAPHHFSFFQTYQRPAYAALAADPRVTLLNNSGAGARDYARWIGIEPARIGVLYNGVDLSGLGPADPHARAQIRGRFGIPDDAAVVGTIFTLYAVKRPRLWLQTAAAYARREPAAHFLVVGDGPQLHALKRLSRKLGLENRLHFTGRQSDIAAYLAAMDAFLLTSRIEGLPNVLLEAQWLGVPVVATSVGGVAEAIDPGVTGFAVASDRPEALADALARAVGDREWRARAVRQGPAFVERRFSIQRMIEETLQVYEMAIHSDSPGGNLEPKA